MFESSNAGNREMKSPIIVSSYRNEDEPPKELSLPKRVCNWVASFISSPEVPLFLYFMAIGIFQTAQQRLVVGKICLYKYKSLAICEQVQTNPLLQPEKEEIASDFVHFSLIAALCTNLPLIIVAVGHGSLCDRWAHKPSMIIPHIGDALLAIFYLLFAKASVTLFNPVYFGYASILSGLSGSWACVTTACTSYACLSTAPKNRMVRLAMVEAAITAGQLVAYFLNGLVFKNNHYLFAFFIQIAVHLYAVVHILALVKEIHTKTFVQNNLQELAHGSWLRFIWVPSENFPAILKMFTEKPPDRPKQAPKGLRFMLINYIIMSCLVGFKAVAGVIENFLQLPPISMEQNAYALFMAVVSVMMTAALIIGIPIFRSKCVSFSDCAVGIFGLVTRMLALIFFGFADFYPKLAPWLFAVVSMFAVYPLVSLRSGMSKLAEDKKQGRLFAIICQAENFAQTGAAYGFNALFAELAPIRGKPPFVLSLLHGFTFFFVAGCSLLPIIVFVFLGRKRIPNWSFKKYAPHTYNELEENPVN